MVDFLSQVALRADRYLRGLDGRSVAPVQQALDGLAALDEPLPEGPTPPDAVIDLLDRVGSPATVASAGGRFFGFVHGGCLPAALLDEPIDFESLLAAGSMMGSGGMVVVDDSTCMVDFAKFFLKFTAEESCGKCVPCRVGSTRMLEILERISAGEASLDAGDLGGMGTSERLVVSAPAIGLTREMVVDPQGR